MIEWTFYCNHNQMCLPQYKVNVYCLEYLGYIIWCCFENAEKGNYNQCKHSFSDQYFENLVTSVKKNKTPGPEIRIYLYWDRWAINRNYSHWRLEGIYGMCGILCSSARPKPSFGIGNWNQVQVSVSVSGP